MPKTHRVVATPLSRAPSTSFVMEDLTLSGPPALILLANPERRCCLAAHAGLKTPRSWDKASAEAETAGSPAVSALRAPPRTGESKASSYAGDLRAGG